MFFKNKKFKGYTEKDYSFLELNNNEYEIPSGGNHPGSFGFVRKNHIHEGIDLYCEENDIVLSITEGIVVDKGIFTGKEVDSPWWNTTEYIAIKYNHIIFLYGELKLNKFNIGDKIKKGTELGKIIPVLKEFKNNRPLNMLHFECYHNELYKKPVEWNLNSNKDLSLINPIQILKSILIN